MHSHEEHQHNVHVAPEQHSAVLGLLHLLGGRNGLAVLGGGRGRGAVDGVSSGGSPNGSGAKLVGARLMPIAGGSGSGAADGSEGGGWSLNAEPPPMLVAPKLGARRTAGASSSSSPSASGSRLSKSPKSSIEKGLWPGRRYMQLTGASCC